MGAQMELIVAAPALMSLQPSGTKLPATSSSHFSPVVSPLNSLMHHGHMSLKGGYTCMT